MALVVGTLAIIATAVVLASVRVHQIATWRSVVMVAASTGSLKACVEFIRFCERL